MTEFGGGIDELEVNLLQLPTSGLGQQAFTECDDSLPGTNNTTLEHDVVFVYFTVVREGTHGCDVLLSQIELSAGIVSGLSSISAALANSVDLLVHLGTVVVSVLTSTSDRELNVRRMPSTNTGDLPQTSVGLTGQSSYSPPGGYTLITVTLGDTNSINDIAVIEDSVYGDLLLKQTNSKVNLLSNRSTVNLDFHDVGLLLALFDLTNLSVSNDTNNGAVLLDPLQLSGVNLLLVGSQFLLIFGEGLFLALVPVLVESAKALIRKMLGPNGGKGTQTVGGFNVTNNTNHHHGRGFKNCDSFDDFLLVHLGARLVQVAHNVGHTSLVAQKGSKVRCSLRVILREDLYAASVGLTSLTRKETDGPMTGSGELSV